MKTYSRKMLTVPVNRIGATLAEILIAMGIMAVGVSLIASLFPATITQAIRADQMTNSALILHQVRELDDLYPDLLEQSPFTTTDPEDMVRVIVTDPLGWHDADIISAGNQDLYGGTVTNAENIVRRSGDFDASKRQAHRVAASSDTWVTSFEGFVGDTSLAAITSITFEDENSIEGLQAAIDALTARVGSGTVTNPDRPGIRVRLLMETVDSGGAFEREIIDSATINVTGSEAVVTISPQIRAGVSIGRVRVQILEQRYTWMITSRYQLESQGDEPTITSDDFVSEHHNLVVFFRRSITPVFETRYSVSQFNKANEQEYRITWLASQQKPILKQGTWIFEPKNGRWYQIQEVVRQDENDETTSGTADIVLGRDFKVGHGILRSDPTANPAQLKPEFVIIPQGVVDVYTL